jgi:hypothetical protein
MRQPGAIAFTTTILTFALAGAARAEEVAQPAGFGALGQIAVSADLQLEAVHRSQGMGSRTTVVIRPALDYFLMPNISVGGFIGYSSGSASFGPLAGNTDLTEISLGARAGYNLRIADMLSLWGQARLVYSHDTFTPPAGPGTGGSIFAVSLYAPLLFLPAPHFFVGAGPVLSQEIVDSVASQSTATDFGLLSIVGGYFSL